MQLQQKKITVQLKLASRRGTIGRDCLMRVVIKLARYMHYRIKRQASRKIFKQMMSRTMRIKFKKKTNPNLKEKHVYIKKRIPMDIDKEIAPFLRFWHEATWPMFLLRIAVACSRVDKDTLTQAKHVALEASDFISCRIPRYESKYDTKYMTEYISDMNKACGEPFDPYMPATEDQLRFLAGQPVVGKKENKPNKRKRSWRQTKIDEYFKPCRIKTEHKEIRVKQD